MSTEPKRTATPDLLSAKEGFVGPTFSLSNRLKRVLWRITWAALASWTPPPARLWRLALLRAFGADISWKANVYASAKVWAPWNLQMADQAALAPDVTVYNIARVSLGAKAIVSQGAHLCTGTHDHRDPEFPLYAKPIHIGRRAWVCAEAFVGPGVTMAEGSVLAARGVTFADLKAWTVYAGNTATERSTRPVMAT
jgi:putative colanic acid biosynthesis acetyltransferase WcaF